MKMKNEYQKFFSADCFTHHITLSPSHLNEYSVLPLMRKIEFKLNKIFLNSNFPKYVTTDKFKFFIFPEDSDRHLQHFHMLLYSPSKKERESKSKDYCIACKFIEKPFFETCDFCTARVLNDLFAEEIPNVDVQVNITSDFDYYDNFYATKKQRFELDYKDSYLVCS